MAGDRFEDRSHDEPQEKPQPVEDEAEIVADGREHGIVLIAVAPAQEVAAQMTVLFQMADHGLDG